MKTIYPETRQESWEAQRSAGRYHPAIEAKLGNHWCCLSCGTSDRTSFFQEGEEFFALSTNYGLGYAGLQVFKEGEEIGDVSDLTLAKRLAEYALTY